MTNGMAVDVFLVQDAAGGAFDSGDKLARMAAWSSGPCPASFGPCRSLPSGSRG